MRSRNMEDVKDKIRDLVQRERERVGQMAQLNEDMELALRAMAYLIHNEWGHGPISEISDDHGNYKQDQVKALERLEADPHYAFLLESDRT